MKLNKYQLTWISIAIIFIGGIVTFSLLVAKKTPPRQDKESQETIPEYEKSRLPGEIVAQFEEPNLPEEEYDETKFVDLEVPKYDESLHGAGALVSGSAIKAPEGPALPPAEDDIIKLTIGEDNISPVQIIVKRNQSVILQLLNQRNDSIFYLDGMGLVEIIEKDKTITTSFRAPDKATELRYWIEDNETKDIVGEGKLIVN